MIIRTGCFYNIPILKYVGLKTLRNICMFQLIFVSPNILQITFVINKNAINNFLIMHNYYYIQCDLAVITNDHSNKKCDIINNYLIH